MNLLESLIKQLKQNGVQEVTFTLKFQNSNPLESKEELNSSGLVQSAKRQEAQIPQEMLMGDL